MHMGGHYQKSRGFERYKKDIGKSNGQSRDYGSFLCLRFLKSKFAQQVSCNLGRANMALTGWSERTGGLREKIKNVLKSEGAA